MFLLRDSHNTHRWIRFGIFSFQPSEIAKPVLVLFLAWFLQDKLQSIRDWRNTLLPAALPSLVFIVLILKEPDLGTALVCAAVTGADVLPGRRGNEILRLCRARRRSGALLPALPRALAPRAHAGLPESGSDPQGSGFHTIQSLIAVGTGGMRGLGFMEGRQKLFYLPQPHTDFIFANIAEELGLIGALAIIALFVALGYRGLRAASLSKDVVRALSCFWHHGDHPHPGLLQHQRGACAGSRPRALRCRSSLTAVRLCSSPWPALGFC